MICKICGLEFLEKYSKHSNGDYCSKRCARISSSRGNTGGTKKVKCRKCNKEIEVDKRSYNTKCLCSECKIKRTYKDRKNKFTRTCSVCHKKITPSNKNNYCVRCIGKYLQELNYKQYIERWKAGLETGLKGTLSISRYIRKYLFEKYNNKCCKCGWGEINPKSNCIPLQVEHIDGNHENNKEENLQLLCPNCHSLTETYMNLNRGNGRKQRYKK